MHKKLFISLKLCLTSLSIHSMNYRRPFKLDSGRSQQEKRQRAHAESEIAYLYGNRPEIEKVIDKKMSKPASKENNIAFAAYLKRLEKLTKNPELKKVCKIWKLEKDDNIIRVDKLMTLLGRLRGWDAMRPRKKYDDYQSRVQKKKDREEWHRYLGWDDTYDFITEDEDRVIKKPRRGNYEFDSSLDEESDQDLDREEDLRQRFAAQLRAVKVAKHLSDSNPSWDEIN